MKMSKYFFLGLLSLGLVFTGCDDDDDDDQPIICEAPGNLVVDGVSETSVTLSWTSPESAFTIEYGPTGFILGAGTELSATSTTVTIDSLMSDTNYDFYVRTDCAGTTSSFVGPLAALTNEEAFCEPPTNLMVESGTSTSVLVSWTSSQSDWTIEYGVAGFSLGSGTQVDASSNPFTVDNLVAFTEYDFYVRNNCTDVSSVFIGPVTILAANPIVGAWEAYDVSPLLAGLGITGISAEFNGDQTYTVISSAAGAESTLEGTYSVSADPVNGIYSITLSQSSPSNLTSEGIFEIYMASPDSMWYEVAQTDPGITGVTAPTVDAGFGSTSGGAFGETNIQKYLRVE